MADNGHPRVFISYRHMEKVGGPEAEEYNRRHMAWVEQFARDLASYRVEPVFDMRLRLLVGSLFDTDPTKEPAIANLALACMAVCHAYLPILTPGFAERIGYGGFAHQTEWQDGYVFDEWQLALANSNAGRIEIIPIWRNVPAEHILEFPMVVDSGIVFDFTDEADYEQNLQLLAAKLHFGRKVEVPAVDMKLGDWIIKFWTDLMNQAGPED